MVDLLAVLISILPIKTIGGQKISEKRRLPGDLSSCEDAPGTMMI